MLLTTSKNEGVIKMLENRSIQQCRIIYNQSPEPYKTKYSTTRGSDSHKIRTFKSNELQDVGEPSTATKIKESVAIVVILFVFIVGLSILGGAYA